MVALPLAALDRKLLRDLWRLRGHIAAVAVVVACGIASFVAMRGAYDAVRTARDDYYAAYRFADVFGYAKRVPASRLADLRAIDGVSAVYDHVVHMAKVEMPGRAEPAIGRLVSIPQSGPPLLDAVHLRAGRWPEPGRRDELLASEAFARTNGFAPGDAITMIINGRRERMRVAGIAISPEYVNEAFEHMLVPDHRRFGVFWVPRPSLERSLDLEGAFNAVAVTLAPGARAATVIGEIDRLLAPFGGTGAYGRADQFSNRMLEDELRQDRVTGVVVPAIFLAVAAFLVHNVLLRLIGLQRGQIGVLKAFGYGATRIAVHYAELALLAVLTGALAGLALGAWLGGGLATIYREFFYFPSLVFRVDLATAGLVILIAVATALLGAVPAARTVMALAPAEAMRPAPPARYRPTLVERAGFAAAVPLMLRMTLRNLERRPLRAALAVLALTLAGALLVVGRYSLDAIDRIVQVQFRLAMREDVAVYFTDPRGRAARDDVARLPGVLAAEPFRMVAVQIRHGARTRRTAIQGVAADGALRRVVDRSALPVAVPPAGLVMSAALAAVLGVRPGDTVEVQVLEGARPLRTLQVARLVDEYIGLVCYLNLEETAGLVGDAGTYSGVFVRADGALVDRLYATLRDMPGVAVVGLREATLQGFYDTIAKNLRVMTLTLIGFACAIAAGMIYNGARIALSEHAVELASLRILGFTRAEVGTLLVTEQAVLMLAAIPLGNLLGYGASAWLAHLASGEMFRLPVAIRPSTYLFGTAVVVAAAAASAALVLARLRRFDLVEALKSRE